MPDPTLDPEDEEQQPPVDYDALAAQARQQAGAKSSPPQNTQPASGGTAGVIATGAPATAAPAQPAAPAVDYDALANKARVQANPDEQVGMLHKMWDWANRGLISPEKVMKYVGGYSPEDLEAMTAERPGDAEHTLPVFGNLAGFKAFARGAAKSAGGVTSSFTSPVSLTLMATGAGEAKAAQAGMMGDAAELANAAGNTEAAATAARLASTTGKVINAVPGAAKVVKAVLPAAGAGFAVNSATQLGGKRAGETTADTLERNLQAGGGMAMGAAGAVSPFAAAHGPIGEVPGRMMDAAGKAVYSAVEGADPVSRGVSDGIDKVSDIASNAANAVGKTILPSKYLAPTDALTRAIRPRNTNLQWDAAIKSALPDMKAAETTPITADPERPAAAIDQTIDLVKRAKENVWKEYSARLDPNLQETISGKDIADAITGTIDKYTRLHNPELVKKIEQKAARYENLDLPLEDAEDFLHSINKRDATYFAKNKISRRQATGDPEIAADLAEGDAIRTGIYDKLDSLTGPGAADIKGRYGALSNVEQELYNRRNAVARQAPESLSEQLAGWASAARIARGAMRIGIGDVAGGTIDIGGAIVGRKAAQYIRDVNQADNLLEQGFRDAGKSPAGAPASPPATPPQPNQPPGPGAATPPQPPPTTTAGPATPTAPGPQAANGAQPAAQPVEAAPTAPAVDTQGPLVPQSGNVPAAQPAATLPRATGQVQQVRGPNGEGPQVPRGKATTVTVPGETTQYPAHYEVRELEDIQASHSGRNFLPNKKYGTGVDKGVLKNERDYTKPANQATVLDHSDPSKFDPRYLITDNPDATNGPPIIDGHGNVLGGNNRAMTIQRTAAYNPRGMADYQTRLAAEAEKYGVADQLAGKKNPVLVRVIPDEAFQGGDISREGAVRDFNKKGTAELTPSERAIADSRRVSQGTMDHVASVLEASGPDATMAKALEKGSGLEVLQRLIDDGVISPQERGGLANAEGLTKDGKERIGKLMIGRFFQDPAHIDNTSPSVRAKIERVGAPISKTEGLPDEWNLVPHFRDALSILERMRAQGNKTVGEFINQEGLFGKQQHSPQSIGLAEALQKAKPLALQQAARQFAEDATYGSKPTLMGDAPTPQAAFADSFGKLAPETQSLPQPEVLRGPDADKINQRFENDNPVAGARGKGHPFPAQRSLFGTPGAPKGQMGLNIPGMEDVLKDAARIERERMSKLGLMERAENPQVKEIISKAPNDYEAVQGMIDQLGMTRQDAVNEVVAAKKSAPPAPAGPSPEDRAPMATAQGPADFKLSVPRPKGQMDATRVEPPQTRIDHNGNIRPITEAPAPVAVQESAQQRLATLLDRAKSEFSPDDAELFGDVVKEWNRVPEYDAPEAEWRSFENRPDIGPTRMADILEATLKRSGGDKDFLAKVAKGLVDEIDVMRQPNESPVPESDQGDEVGMLSKAKGGEIPTEDYHVRSSVHGSPDRIIGPESKPPAWDASHKEWNDYMNLTQQGPTNPYSVWREERIKAGLPDGPEDTPSWIRSDWSDANNEAVNEARKRNGAPLLTAKQIREGRAREAVKENLAKTYGQLGWKPPGTRP